MDLLLVVSSVANHNLNKKQAEATATSSANSTLNVATNDTLYVMDFQQFVKTLYDGDVQSNVVETIPSKGRSCKMFPVERGLLDGS